MDLGDAHASRFEVQVVDVLRDRVLEHPDRFEPRERSMRIVRARVADRPHKLIVTRAARFSNRSTVFAARRRAKNWGNRVGRTKDTLQ